MVHGLAALDENAVLHSHKGAEIEPSDNRNKATVRHFRRFCSSSFQSSNMNRSRSCTSQAGLYTAVFIYFLCGNAVLLPW